MREMAILNWFSPTTHRPQVKHGQLASFIVVITNYHIMCLVQSSKHDLRNLLFRQFKIWHRQQLKTILQQAQNIDDFPTQKA